MNEPQQPSPLRILLVDDHEASTRALARLLRSSGFLVTSAYTFAGALALAAGPGAVQLLICDVDLPDGNGCELLQRLRAFLGGRPLPAIAMTGHGDRRDECARAGYAHFLHKPLEVRDVLEAIRAACPSRCAPAPAPAPATQKSPLTRP